MIEWLQALLAVHGFLILFLVLFLNNVGLPLPGTTLLLGAGFLAGQGDLSMWGIGAAAVAGCFLGTNCGYWIGRRFGKPVLNKFHWLRLTPARVRRMERFSENYGAPGVFIARFVALLHPVIGLLAGVSKVPLGPFLLFNLAGSVAYAFLYTLAGNLLGRRWGLLQVWIGHHVVSLVLGSIFLILAVLYWRYFKAEEKPAREKGR